MGKMDLEENGEEIEKEVEEKGTTNEDNVEKDKEEMDTDETEEGGEKKENNKEETKPGEKKPSPFLKTLEDHMKEQSAEEENSQEGGSGSVEAVKEVSETSSEKMDLEENGEEIEKEVEEKGTTNE